MNAQQFMSSTEVRLFILHPVNMPLTIGVNRLSHQLFIGQKQEVFEMINKDPLREDPDHKAGFDALLHLLGFEEPVKGRLHAVHPGMLSESSTDSFLGSLTPFPDSSFTGIPADTDA